MSDSEPKPDESWRIIDEGVYDEATHHALDEVLIKRLNRHEIAPASTADTLTLAAR